MAGSIPREFIVHYRRARVLFIVAGEQVAAEQPLEVEDVYITEGWVIGSPAGVQHAWPREHVAEVRDESPEVAF